MTTYTAELVGGNLPGIPNARNRSQLRWHRDISVLEIIDNIRRASEVSGEERQCDTRSTPPQFCSSAPREKYG